ncbi:taperin [Lagenorhynchus albirostris]|uniref:taperin n=1 Tax=Lagenorhynchus albirostris TaxID=27610 RepID=UPI0028E85B0B|nr:taperin [Lagenorhynchus albirostris]
MAGLGRPSPAPRATMPAWKREILERKRAKLAALGGGAAPGAGAGEEEPAGPAAEPLVLAESLGPLRENPFMRLESERRHGARRGGASGAAGPGTRPAQHLLELYRCVPGVRTIRADNILIIESAPGFPPSPVPGPGPGPAARIRAAEVLVYEAPPPPGRVSRLLQKFDPPAAPRRRGSPERGRPVPPPPSPGPALVPRVGERAACFQPEPERCGAGPGPGPRRSDFLHKTGSNSFTVHPRGLRRSAGTRPLPNGPAAPERRAGAANGLTGSAPGPGEWKPKVELGEAPAHPLPSPGTPSATLAAPPALPTLSPASATPNQRQWVSAATSANDSFEILPASKPDMDTVPAGDLQARALASLRMNSRNSFVFIPKRKTSGAPPAEGRQSVGPPEGEVGWASQHQEREAQQVPGADGVFAGGRSPSGVEEGGCPVPGTPLVDWTVRWQRLSSPPPSPLVATEAEPAQGFGVPGLTKNGREPGRPGLPVTFIDEVDSEDEVPQEAKLPCPGAGVPPQYHPHPTGPGHLSELQHRGGNTFTVVPKRKPGALQANGEARPREAEEEGPGSLSEPPAALGTSVKKRYPTVHEIEVIGGYLALQKSCLIKAGSSRKKMKISFNDKSLQTTFEYPPESSLQEEEAEAEKGRDEEEESEEGEGEGEPSGSDPAAAAAEKPFALFLPRATFVNSVGPESPRLPDGSSGLSSYTPKHSVAFSKWQERALERVPSTEEPPSKEVMLTPAGQNDLADFRSEPALYF